MYGVVGMAANWPIIGQIAILLGFLMNFISDALYFLFGSRNIGVMIIIFTVIIFTAMLPLTVKQQKNAKLTQVMNPEIQKIQKKYSGKRDQATMAKQQEEMQVVYAKYGTSPMGGCLPALMQMPIFFALWPVIQNIPRYVAGVRNMYDPIIAKMEYFYPDDWVNKLAEFVDGRSELNILGGIEMEANTVASFLFRFQDATWQDLYQIMPEIQSYVREILPAIDRMNQFMGINMGETPFSMLQLYWSDFGSIYESVGRYHPIVGILLAVSIPLAAGVTQFASVKLMPTQPQQQTDSQIGNSIGGSMKAMTYMMPLFSIFMGFTLPAGMGLYWAISALVRVVQQLLINAKLKKIPLEELIEQSRAKAAKKRAKKGEKSSKLQELAKMSTRHIEEKKQEELKKQEEVKKAKKTSATTATEKVDKEKKQDKNDNEEEKVAKEEKEEKEERKVSNAKPGSLAARANLVSRYNSGQSLSDQGGENDE